MVVGIEVGDIKLARLQHHQNGVVLVKLAEQTSVLVIVDAVHIGVEPHLPSAERRVAVALQSYAMNGVSCYELSLGTTSLDRHEREVFLYDDLPKARVSLKDDLYYLCLAVGVGGEIHYA